MLKVISLVEQISNNLKSISKSKSDNKFLLIIEQMKTFLKYNEVEILINSIENNYEYELFLNLFNKEKYFWENQIENIFFEEFENAKLSLNSSDYLAYLIGKKVDLQKLINEKKVFLKQYKNIDLDINLEILKNYDLCKIEVNQKVNVPVNYAISMFLFHDQKIATIKFKRIISDDKNNRLTSHNAEYILIFERFFDRLKLDFIPKINPKNNYNPIEFNNAENKYITIDKLRELIDNENFFNNREFEVSSKKLLKPKNIVNLDLLKEVYNMFFKSIDDSFKKSNIDVFISSLTETNPMYDDFDIKNTRYVLNNLLTIDDKHIDFLILTYFLESENVLYKSRNILNFLFTKYFNKVRGMSNDNIKEYFFRKKLEFKKSINNNIYLYIKSNSLNN